jgi:hypothetical protein
MQFDEHMQSVPPKSCRRLIFGLVWPVVLVRPAQGELQVEVDAGAGGRRLRQAGRVHVREDLQALGLHLMVLQIQHACVPRCKHDALVDDRSQAAELAA